MNPLAVARRAPKPELWVIGVGASAGGMALLIDLLSSIPANLPACIVIVLHLAPDHKSYLAEILQRHSKMRVKEARDKDQLRAGVVYIAPPNAHVRVVGNKLRLNLEPPVEMHRPSVDVLFESIAGEFKRKGIGVLLSGSGHDGSEGLRALKAAGGLTVVQDPREASFASMPAHGIDTGCVDYVVSIKDLATHLSALCIENTG